MGTGRRSLRFIQRGKLQIQWLPKQFGGGEMNLDPWFSISLCLDCRRMLLRFAWRRGERQANPRLRLRFQSDIRCDIPELNGDNYKIWKERVLLHLGWMDIDYAIRKDKPPIKRKGHMKKECTKFQQWLEK
uniref:Uncharacterized protein n=1 Tax=Musa acuminata subsp. malaccensis TaxID=214687 RepID=A0A804JWV2_MUSAM